jgi:hypothetical protein
MLPPRRRRGRSRPATHASSCSQEGRHRDRLCIHTSWCCAESGQSNALRDSTSTKRHITVIIDPVAALLARCRAITRCCGSSRHYRLMFGPDLPATPHTSRQSQRPAGATGLESNCAVPANRATGDQESFGLTGVGCPAGLEVFIAADDDLFPAARPPTRRSTTRYETHGLAGSQTS